MSEANRPTREQCEKILLRAAALHPQDGKRYWHDVPLLARAYLALLDECESLRRQEVEARIAIRHAKQLLTKKGGNRAECLTDGKSLWTLKELLHHAKCVLALRVEASKTK